jgi:hypothetical protein
VYHGDVLRVALVLLATAPIARRLLKGRTYCAARCCYIATFRTVLHWHVGSHAHLPSVSLRANGARYAT